MTICYFTGTGNCLYVARRIGGYLYPIPQLMTQDEIIIKDDAVGIVCPCYAGEMPMMVRDFLIKADIETEYLFFVYTYGMNYGAAFANAKLACEEGGLKLSYVNAIKMVDNYLPGFEMQNQLDTLPKKDVEGQIARLIDDIEARKNTEVSITSGTKAKIKLQKKFMGDRILRRDAAREYIVTDDCILCGTCQKVCPSNNVNVTDKVRFGLNCEVCYACIHNCPKTAIHLKNEKSAVRYRNEHVALKDLFKRTDNER